MQQRRPFIRGSVIGIGLLMACAGAHAQSAGPDVMVEWLGDIDRLTSPLEDVVAFSVATTSCNIGDTPINWSNQEPNPNEHPVISQSIYRIKNNRIEQLGMSWVKHGFFALANDGCGNECQDPGTGRMLGIGCGDPYDAPLNGLQAGLGPRSQINPVTGDFPYPFTAPPASGDTARRIQIRRDDIQPALNAGALFFAEGLYITADDAAAGNGNNNASYQHCNFGNNSSLNPATVGITNRGSPAIFAWRDHGLGFNFPDPDVVLTPVDVPDDGRFWVGSRAADEGDGTWRYEYAVYNLNSARAGASFEVALPAGATVTAPGFRDIDHHSGEPYDNIDWAITVGADAIQWDVTTSHADSNALRWGTMFNFWFTADAPPASGSATLALFEPAGPTDPNTMTAEAAVPAAGCACDTNTDGSVSITDLLTYLEWFFDGLALADFNGSGGPPDIVDLLSYLECFFDGC